MLAATNGIKYLAGQWMKGVRDAHRKAGCAHTTGS
jgi:hypothetical protein